MSFRDDHDAARARVVALEAEIARERERAETAIRGRAEVVRDHERLRTAVVERNPVKARPDRPPTQTGGVTMIAVVVLIIAAYVILFGR